MKAAIYSRFSTDRQDEGTIADQVRVCTERAAKEGWKVILKFEDQGISGAAIGNRPGFIKMHEAALARKFDVLIVADLSRLSRSQGDLAKAIDRLVAKGVRIIGIQDGYDSSRKGSKVQAGMSGIMGEWFRELVKEKTYAALETRAKEQRPTGGKSYGYDGRKINAEQAKIITRIFERFVAGAGLRAIAAELNKKGIASPGSSWKRETRRGAGWMGSSIRVIVRNELYVGQLIWNKSQWTKDPDSGKRTNKMRPKSEWIRHTDESLRIVPQALWDLAQRRIASTSLSDDDKKARRKVSNGSYVLSGLLKCSHCGANFVMSGAYSYACSSHVFGKNCTNTIRVSRLVAESKLVDPIFHTLLSAVETAKMVREAQRFYGTRAKEAAGIAGEAPAELVEVEKRLTKLRARLAKGDEDMTADEIQGVIDKVEGQRNELKALARPSEHRRTAQILAMIPRAAERIRREIAAVKGKSPNPEVVAKLRVTLRGLFGGSIKLVKEGRSLYAEYRMHRELLLDGERIGSGSGGAQCFRMQPMRTQLI